MTDHIHTSDEILNAEDLYDFSERAANLCYPKYKLTEGEVGWLCFVNGKYSIADAINERLDDDYILSVDAHELSVALSADNGNCPFAACLSEDTALAKILFWCFDEEACND